MKESQISYFPEEISVSKSLKNVHTINGKVSEEPEFDFSNVVVKQEKMDDDNTDINELTNGKSVEQDYSNIVVKTEPGLEHLINTNITHDSAIIKQENQYSVGDFVWAQMASYPFWPAMISPDKETNEHMKHIFKKKLTTYCHIHFFGDNGRWCWMNINCLMPYRDRNDLKRLKEERNAKQPKDKWYKALTVGTSSLAKWLKGLDELDSIFSKSLEEKLTFFKKFEKKSSPKRKSLLQKSVRSEVKIEESVEESNETLKKKPKGIQKIRNSLPVTKLKPNEISKTRNSLPVPETRKKFGTSSLTASSPESRPNEVENSESSASSSSDSEMSKTSDSPDSIDNPLTLKDQTVLFKKCNLFKRMGKEKVCSVCEKPENLKRCKGFCSGYYHKDCAELRIEELEKRTSLDGHVKLASPQKEKITESTETITNSKVISMSDCLKLDKELRTMYERLLSNCHYGTESDYDESESESEPVNHTKHTFFHVTGDSDGDTISIEDIPNTRKSMFKCINCIDDVEQLCFVCHKLTHKDSSIRQRCSVLFCGKYFHPACLKMWPQTQWSASLMTVHRKTDVQLNSVVCPMHNCHTCVSENPKAVSHRVQADKLVKCTRCPATYHASNFCIPAGSKILTISQIICPRHCKNVVPPNNTNWCHICGKGGDIICCETCPVSVHPACQDLNLTEDGLFICEDCDSCRFPLYNEVVWSKCGSHRWWPAQIQFPNEIPSNLWNRPHQHGDFVVKFFGTNYYCWLNRGKVFLYQDGDHNEGKSKGNRKEILLQNAVKAAEHVYRIKQEFLQQKEVMKKQADNKPPPYIKLKFNKPVGNVRMFDGNSSNTTPCSCDPSVKDPCGPDSRCLNRMLLIECDPEICPAGSRCQNQDFETRNYPKLEPSKTEGRGWGLKTLQKLVKGQFIIEYVGELVDESEYQRRITQMNATKQENYYFLTLDNQRMIDAGPKGNIARFMNHSCNPNCETQKWTVNGETRIGLFSIQDIPSNSELTFNYNLEVVGETKKKCYCGAPNCSGYIGLKKQKTEPPKKSFGKKVKDVNKKRESERLKTTEVPVLETCFVCGTKGETIQCQHKHCSKNYHLACLNLEDWPGGKWTCPWHSCNECEKRTTRSCMKCINSYCPQHSEGLVRYDKKLLGFLCNLHDSEKTKLTTDTLKSSKKKHKPIKDAVISSIEDDLLLINGLNIFNSSLDLKKLDHIPLVEDIVNSLPIKLNEKENKTPKKRKLSNDDNQSGNIKKRKYT